MDNFTKRWLLYSFTLLFGAPILAIDNMLLGTALMIVHMGLYFFISARLFPDKAKGE